MMTPRLIPFLVVLAASPCLRAQSEAAIADREARVLAATFKKQIKAGKNSLTARIEAVQELGQYSHGSFVKPLLTVARSDKAKSVRQKAAEAIGNQPKKNARPALVFLLSKTKINKDPGLTASVVRAINKSCYEARNWSALHKLFERSLSDRKAVDAQLAILQVARTQKEIQAIDLLVQHIDEPAPVWVDDPSNPPASYWEARYKNWQRWRTQVKSALYAITDQRFGTAKEARTWLKKNRRNLESKRRAEARRKPKN